MMNGDVHCTIVVYDSLYGNTEIVARVIGENLPGEVRVVRVDEVQVAELVSADLLVVGSPTHGALPTDAVQRLVDGLGAPTKEGALAATFDTRLTWRFLERWGGFAAPKIAEMLADKGWAIIGEPVGFLVRGLRKGPLMKGEAERAARWTSQLAKGGKR
jgi:flavodoxin